MIALSSPKSILQSTKTVFAIKNVRHNFPQVKSDTATVGLVVFAANSQYVEPVLNTNSLYNTPIYSHAKL